MDKKDWENLIEEPMSDELKARTMARARQELDKNQESRFIFSLKWLFPLVPGLALLLLFINQKKRSDETPLAQKDLGQEQEFFEEISDWSLADLEDFDEEILTDLEFYEDLELLEEWDGREEV